METWKLLIEGKVQGVCYRASVIKFVENHSSSIVGYAKNLSNGKVEIIASSDKESLEQLKEFCSVGPELAKVEKIEIFRDQVNIEHLSGFKIY